MTEQWQELKETITEMRDNGGTGTQQDVCKFLANLMDVLEKQMQQPSEDCISRQKALDCFEQTNTRQGAKYAIETLPSVTPQKPKGKWIEVDVRDCHATLKCSVCDRVITPTFTFDEYSYEDIKTFYPYCHCGAEMDGGGEDGEDSACD